jgi:hypothetical protein
MVGFPCYSLTRLGFIGRGSPLPTTRSLKRGLESRFGAFASSRLPPAFVLPIGRQGVGVKSARLAAIIFAIADLSFGTEPHRRTSRRTRTGGRTTSRNQPESTLSRARRTAIKPDGQPVLRPLSGYAMKPFTDLRPRMDARGDHREDSPSAWGGLRREVPETRRQPNGNRDRFTPKKSPKNSWDGRESNLNSGVPGAPVQYRIVLFL